MMGMPVNRLTGGGLRSLVHWLSRLGARSVTQEYYLL